MMDDPDEPRPVPKSRRHAFLTKVGIAALTLLVFASIVLAALGATSVLTPQDPNASNKSIGNSNGSFNGGNNGGHVGTTSINSSISNDDHGSNPSSNVGIDSNNDHTDNNNKNTTAPAPKPSPSPWRPVNSSTIASGVPLRIMCLGASIVRGELSSTRNGFRAILRSDLSSLSSAPINMVGSQRNGDMPDNDFEAYGGNRISQIHAHATQIVPEMQPNVFVINVGTNNVLQDRDIGLAGQHMREFIDYLLATAPRATVILSTLLTNTVPGREPAILDINRQFRKLYKGSYEGKEAAVVLAELHPETGLQGRPQAEDISSDGSHPTDRGYEIMGHILAQAVMDADEKGYLRWPEDGLPYDGEVGRETGT
ncbi:SGNH hydrolase-type esterase domain-containing protein [Nemania sp. FL0916]|nr:SGNH hydrolase-type esterase domain-containing protein [Nemania sp. FL0916]